MRPDDEEEGSGGRGQERINWVVATSVTAVGLAAIAGGVVLGRGTRDTWSGVLVNVGTSVALVVALLLVERRMTQRVIDRASAIARAEAAQGTADLRDRLVRLEQLDEAQARARDERRAQLDAEMAAIDNGVDVATIGRLLRAAVDDRLLDFEGGFRLRTSDDPQCHLLYLLGHEAAGRTWAMFLDFHQFSLGEPFDGIPMPAARPSTVMWTDEGAGDIAAELESRLEQANVPLHGFSLRYSLTQLRRAIEIARRARQAEAGDPRRLAGTLQLLINDDWVITTSGLESVNSAVRFTHGWVPLPGQHWSQMGLIGPQELEGSEDPALVEALAWIRDRDGRHVVFGDVGHLPPPNRLGFS